MKAGYQIELSSAEICVLAGLLGYAGVVGINHEECREWQADIRCRVTDTVNQLEQKKRIQYHLDGTLMIDAALRRVMTCLCEADVVWSESTNTHKRSSQTAYTLFKGDDAVTCCAARGKKYRLTLQAKDEWIRDKLASETSTDASWNGKLLFEEAQQIREMFASFEADRAQAYLTEIFKDERAREAAGQLLSGQTTYRLIRIDCRKDAVYTNAVRTAIAVDRHQPFSVSMDEFRVVRLEAIDLFEQTQQWIRYVNDR